MQTANSEEKSAIKLKWQLPIALGLVLSRFFVATIFNAIKLLSASWNSSDIR